MNLIELKKPFPECDLEWRISQVGIKKDGSLWAKCLAYVDNRAIQDRLDDVVGPENWKNEFKAGPEGGVICALSLFIREFDSEKNAIFSRWLTKEDGAENTQFEAIKGGLSGAMKRAAVQWGIGRYLYSLNESYATVYDVQDGRGAFYVCPKKDKHPSFKWDPPQIPWWALPSAYLTLDSILQKVQKKNKDDVKEYADSFRLVKYMYTPQEVCAIRNAIKERLHV